MVVPTGQLPAAQVVPAAYSPQAPAPLQRPVVPQLAAPASVQVREGSVSPAVTGEQVPALPVTPQDMHTPVQAVAQQTP